MSTQSRFQKNCPFVILLFLIASLAGRGWAIDDFQHWALAVEEKISQMDWGEGEVYLAIEDAEVPLVLYHHQSDAMEWLGSLSAIPTSLAAIERLGAQYHFPTRLYLGGTVADGTLEGPLLIEGTGDPTIGWKREDDSSTNEVFEHFAKALREQGVKHITGGVIADGRFLPRCTTRMGWARELFYLPQFPVVSGVNYNLNCWDFSIERKGMLWWKKPAITIYPELEGLPRVVSLIELHSPQRRLLRAERTDESNLVQIVGDLGEQSTELQTTMLNPELYFAEVACKILEEHGIKIDDSGRSAHEMSPPEFPETRALLTSWQGPSLPEVIQDILYHQPTLHAEVLYETLGRLAPPLNPRAGLDPGAASLDEWFTRHQLAGSGHLIADGSGRSRNNRLSVEQITELLRTALNDKKFAPFIAAMPGAATPRSLVERRMSPMLGAQRSVPIWATVASHPNCEGVAGWLDSIFERRLVFAIVVRRSSLPPAVIQRQIDEILLTLTQAE